ncbi:MAG: N-acetylmuramoyl-L-alanine amidase [Selenomonadaceae bacterium]|nr:N-acetylmuramoyl-L-alanine amidase [Selenomonadaceae bacterium]
MIRKILLSLLILIAATSAAQAGEQIEQDEQTFSERKATLAEVSAVRVGYGAGTIRIVVDTTKKVDFTESYAENPSRVIIDLKDSWLSPTVKREIELKSLAAKKIRVAQFDPTTVRIVIETMADTKPFHLDGGPKGHRFVVDVGNADFKPNAEAQVQPQPKPEVKPEPQPTPEVKPQPQPMPEVEIIPEPEVQTQPDENALKEQQERELREQLQREQAEKERLERELLEQKERELREQHERELREKIQREQEEKARIERELQEQKERELKEKQERELREKIEREVREKVEREMKEKEKQERELKEQLEREQKEKEKLERELKKKLEREQKEKLERDIKEQREREKALKEKEKKDKKDKKDKKEEEKQPEPETPLNELEQEFETLTALKGKKIVIDPGHGGNDAGAIGPTGVMEKNVTLKVSLELKKLLEAEGATVILTRETDRTVSEKGAKASDIEELGARCDVANRNGADIFISIHADSFTRPEARGTTGYYYSKSTSGRGQKLADCIRRNLVEQLGTPSRGTQPCNFYVVKHTDMPATLIELGFISNKDEEKLLDSKEGVLKAAQGIFDGIEDYFG